MSVKELIQMSELRLIFKDVKTDKVIYDYNDVNKFEDVKFINTYCDKRIVRFGEALINSLYVYI